MIFRFLCFSQPSKFVTLKGDFLFVLNPSYHQDDTW